ncbi:MAG TPA: hypothetical protein VF228_00560 [Iamia sp.]
MEVRPCRPDEVGALQAFIAETWRADHVLAHDEDLLRWQFGGLVGSDAPTVVLAVADDGTVLGMQGVIEAPLTIHGRTVRAAWLANLMASPEGRAQGAGMKLLWASFKMGYDVLLSLGVNADMRATLPSLRYEILDPLPRWAAVVDAAAPTGTGAGPVAVEPVDRLDDEWDRVWDLDLAPSLVGTRRDARFLTWRYLAHPTFTYAVRLARRRGAAVGLAVHRVEAAGATGPPAVRLVELVGDPEARSALLADVVDTARSAGAPLVDWYGTAPYDDELRTAGFVPVEAGGPVPSRFSPLVPHDVPFAGAFRAQAKHTGLVGRFLSAPGLHLTKGDGDMDRPNIVP